ncbi:MAG: hypothetical protein IMZ43_01600, partial [Thermoplasmata archaeon]|nr:hypothetical protein [Thermoplasmata archaeon]
MMRAISLLLVLCFLALPVSAIGVINPSTESQPIWCQFYYTKWICGTGTSGTGGIGPQGIPGINGTVGEGDINYFNFTGSNLTTISNITNFFTYSEMNQTANMTAGPQGIEGPMGPANMTAGPQGSPGEIPDSSQFYFLNGTRTLTGNMNAGSKQIASLITGATGDTATNKTYVDAVNISMKNYADAQNATAITDHGALTGLTDDDHVRYFDKDTSKALTGRDLGRNVDNSYIVIRGGTTNANSGYVVLYGYNAGSAYNGGFGFAVTNAAHTATTELMAGRGNIDAPYLNMLSHAISNVLDPLSAQDAATRNYVLHPDYTASAQSNA